MIFLGIDPGKTGAIVALNSPGFIEDIETDMTPSSIFIFLEKYVLMHDNNMFVFLEKAQSMPGNKASSMFTYGVSNGEIMGFLLALGLPYELVSPRVWQKPLHAGVKAGTAKKKSLLAAKRLFPKEAFLDPRKPKSYTPHDGIVDALLIAEYGRRKRLSYS